MNEQHLHDLWRKRKLGPIGLRLSDNRTCSIIHYGFYNQSLAGPDFSMGIIDIDGIEEVGPIEMHLRASDWYRHGHQHDVRYNNVILHVVYIHDLDVIQNGRKVPTLNLMPLIAVKESSNNKIINEIKLPCRSFLSDMPKEVFEKVKVESLVIKIENKLKSIEYTDYKRGTLYRLLASAFGTHANKNQFLQLTYAVPLESLVGEKPDYIYNLLLDKSELFSDKKSRVFDWNFKGLRPANFPTIRVKQFAMLVSSLLFDETFINAMDDFDTKLLSKLISSLNSGLDPALSKAFIEHIIINACVPYFYYCNKAESISVIRAFLHRTKVEKNERTRLWEDNGLAVENAYDSQSLNGLYTYLCANRKCLSCGIGSSIMNT